MKSGKCLSNFLSILSKQTRFDHNLIERAKKYNFHFENSLFFANVELSANRERKRENKAIELVRLRKERKL